MVAVGLVAVIHQWPPRQVIIPGIGDAAGQGYEVIVWSGGHCDYAPLRKAAPADEGSPDRSLVATGL